MIKVQPNYNQINSYRTGLAVCKRCRVKIIFKSYSVLYSSGSSQKGSNSFQPSTHQDHNNYIRDTSANKIQLLFNHL